MKSRPGQMNLNRIIARWSPLRIAFTLGALVALAKLPLLFTTIGEHDQGRLILDAIVYVQDGPGTLRKYGLFTSPLWTLSMALLARIIGTASLVLVSNIGGWLCGGVLSAMSFLLAHALGASRAWSAAAAVAVALVPGTFYMSLYGYPSQFALPLMVFSAWSMARACDTDRYTFTWLAVSAAAYCVLILTKIDFALAGTLMLAVVIVRAGWNRRVLSALPLIAILGAAAALIVTRIAIDGRPVELFLRDVGDHYAWQAGQLFKAPAATVLYSCGLGTLGLFVLAGVVAIRRRASRSESLHLLVAWAVGTLPLWIFWLARPPMSNRHAVPGVVVTVLFAALLGRRAFRFRLAPVAWLFLVVGINWGFGEPSPNFNYLPSGDLAATLRINRRAFAVAEGIARDVVRKPEASKVIVGKNRKSVLHGVDLLPFIEIAMAQKSRYVSAVGDGWPLVFTDAEGSKTVTIPTASVGLALRYHGPDATFYSLYGDNVTPLQKQGMRVVSFDPNARLAEAR